MFPRQQRLTRQEFTKYFQSGKRWFHTDLQIIYYPSPSLKTAIVVSKKVNKSAVGRHLIKRQSSHALREVLKERQIKQGVFIVILKPLPVKDGKFIFNNLKKALGETIAKIT